MKRRIGMRTWTGVLVSVLAAGCGSEEPDAYGNFEAEEVTVSAETGGPLIRFDVVEGTMVNAGESVGLVDTTQIALQIRELEAQRSASEAQTGQAGAQVGALEAELRAAESELARTRRLYDAEAATRRQLEQASSRVDVLREQIQAARQSTVGARDQTDATGARVALLRERLESSRVENPINGTVLTTYTRAGEYVQPGQPLYTVADLSTLELRAYVAGSQLAHVRLGQEVEVLYDLSVDERGSRPGVVSWISPEAEFTPTPIQTREERADLVYAVTVRVPNTDGALKIGMPGELRLPDPQDATQDVE